MRDAPAPGESQLSTYAIGDVQGCRAELELLLARFQFDPAADTLWFLGDMINRGPDNLGTLRLIRSLGPAAHCVLGNHDLHFLAVAEGQHKAVHKDTFADLLAAPELPELTQWLRHLPLLHHDAALGFVFVHAGLPPIWNLRACIGYAEEVETILRGDSWTDFLSAMYGNEPAIWTESLTGLTRARVITNYFTRMRYCTADGSLDLTAKGADCPAGFAPWFNHKPPASEEAEIAFGHWAAIEGECSTPKCHALDTGCVWGRDLTALRLNDLVRFSVQALEATDAD